MKLKNEKGKKDYILFLYLKKVMIKLMKQVGIRKYIIHYFIMLFTLIEIATIMIDVYVYETTQIQEKRISLTIFLTIVLVDFIIVILIKKNKIDETVYKVTIFVIIGAILESFVQERQKYFRVIAFFLLQQISTRNMDVKKQIINLILFILIAFAQVRYSISNQSSILDMVEFFICQLANISFSLILTFDDDDYGKGKEFLNIQSHQAQNDDVFLSGRRYLNNPNNNDNLNSHNNSLQMNPKKGNNLFDQSSILDNQLNNCKRSFALNFQENLNDISQEYARNTQTQGVYDKNRQTTYGFEYDKVKHVYILKNEKKNNYLSSGTLTTNLVHYLNKSLNLISIGIMLINNKKQLTYRNKVAKKFINLKNSNRDLLGNILSISLQMLKEEAQKELTQENVRSNNKSEGGQKPEKKITHHQRTIQQQKEDLFNSMMEDSQMKRQKQLFKPQKSKFQQQEKFGQVIYNQYESSKLVSENNINPNGLRRITTVEVMSTENNSVQPQRQVNSNLNIEIPPNILSNMSNNIISEDNNVQSYHKINSNISIKNNYNYNKNLIPVKANTNSLYQRDKQLSPCMVSSENIIQELNASAIGVPLTNISPSNLQNSNFNNKTQVKSAFNQANLKGSTMINKQSSLNGVMNHEELISKFTQCLIPENIDKLFKHKDLTLNDVVDYLIHHSKSYQQQKYNTDYLIYPDSDEEQQTIHHKNKSQLHATQTGKSKKSTQNQDADVDDFKDNDVQNDDEEDDDDDEEEDDIYEDEEDQILEKSVIQDFQLEKKSQSADKIIKHERNQSTKRTQKPKKKKKKKNHQKLYSYFIQNNYLHVHTTINQIDSEYSDNDKQQKFIEIKLSVLSSDTQEDKFVLIELADVTKFKKIVDKENLDHYKNKILSSVSHELRTPLNCSIQLLDLLSQSDDIQDLTKQTFVNPALYSNYLLLNIINDILDLAQINYGQFRMIFSLFELKKIISECFNLIGLQAMQKELLLEFEIDPLIPQVINSDANRLRQVLLNLLNNALKFTQQGSITIRANLIEENLIQIDVEDTGCGIKKKDLSRIIGRFGNNDESKDPSLNSVNGGLGLTIANNLATGLGGNRKLKVQSTYKVGSTFSFCIVNHPLNQKGCTYKQTNLFSKQIINWECFSQYSQNLQQGNQFNKLKSDFITVPNQNSSLIKNSNRKNEPRYSDAALNLMRFNSEIMYSNINLNVSGNKLPQQQQQNGNFVSTQKSKEATNYDVYANIANNHNISSDGGRFNRKFQLSMKTSQYANQDQSVTDCISPLKHQNCNNTNGNLTQKQFVENITELQRDESIVDVQYFQNMIETSRKKVDHDQQKNHTEKNKTPSKNHILPQPQIAHHQSYDKPYLPTLFDIKNPHSLSYSISQSNANNLAKQNQAYQASANQCNSNDVFITNENDNSFEYNQQLPPISPDKVKSKSAVMRSNFGQGSQNSEIESCDINQLNEQTNKKLPNTFNCLQISHKRNQSNQVTLKANNIQESQQLGLTNSLFEFDQEDQVIKIQFKDDKGVIRNQFNRIKDETQLSQIHEKSMEHLESAMSSHIDILQQNRIINDKKLNKIYNLNSEKFDLDSLIDKVTNKLDQEKSKNTENNDKSKTNEIEKNKETDLDKQSVSIKVPNQDFVKRDLVRRVTMTSMDHKETYPNNYVNQEEKQQELDIKNQLIQYNSKRECKCANVLIVDDHEFNLYALELRLKSYGFIIDKATSGIIALQKVQAKFEKKGTVVCHKQYEVIFMDIDMPIKNGYETTQDILNYFKQEKVADPTPISACSAYVQESEKVKAKQSGMSYYVTKPVNQQMLEIVLKQTILDRNTKQQ